MEKLTFGIIAEGASDVAVLRNIIRGYRQDIDEDNTNTTRLQPADNKAPAGWPRVWDYCASSRFKDFFKIKNNRAVIQIDTDCCNQWEYDKVPYKFDASNLSCWEIVQETKQQFETFFTNRFGPDFLAQNKHKIIYAISVHSVECWLLPLDTDLGCAAQEIDDCYKLLGEPKKEYQRYWDLSLDFAKKTVLDSCAQQNESLRLFIQELA